MGFVSTANTNTLSVNLTSYGKFLLAGKNPKNSFMSAIKFFGLKDQDIDYRRFGRLPVSGSENTNTNGPCYDQQFIVNPTNERLSGDCFYNYPDIRGGVESNVPYPSVSQVSELFKGGGSNIHWKVGGQIYSDCFQNGYDSTVFGLNDYGCLCTLDLGFGVSETPSYYSLLFVIENFILFNGNTQNIDTETIQTIQYSDNGGLVGDVYGDGKLSCDDVCWFMECWCHSLHNGDISPLDVPNEYKNKIDNLLGLSGCDKCKSSFCDGKTIQS